MPGHSGIKGNKLADRYAKKAVHLPNNPAVYPKSDWDLVVEGELVVGPHKTWGRLKVPHHGHEGIHPISFKPLVRGDMRLVKWLFAVRYVEGYSSPKKFWFNKGGAKNLCSTCLSFHDTSVHGYIAFCDNSSSWVR